MDTLKQSLLMQRQIWSGKQLCDRLMLQLTLTSKMLCLYTLCKQQGAAL